MFTKDDVGLSVYSLKFGEGIIVSIDIINVYPIHVEFASCDYFYNYSLNGKLHENDQTQDLYFSKPEITAPPRPKKKVKKVIERYFNVYPNEIQSFSYFTNHEADLSAANHRIACVKLTGEYEVEE